MNEKIKELWYQAVQPHTGDSWAEQTAFMEKFAELIIQECLDICEDMGNNGKDGHYCADKIAKHFGVKE